VPDGASTEHRFRASLRHPELPADDAAMILSAAKITSPMLHPG
jgi:hypothetical protein